MTYDFTNGTGWTDETAAEAAREWRELETESGVTPMSWKRCMEFVEVNRILAEWARLDGDKYWHANYIALADRYLAKARMCELPSYSEQQDYKAEIQLLHAAE